LKSRWHILESLQKTKHIGLEISMVYFFCYNLQMTTVKYFVYTLPLISPITLPGSVEWTFPSKYINKH